MTIELRYTDEEIEKDRARELRELDKMVDPTGDLCMHEALDRASLAADFVENALLGHPSIVNNATFYRMVHQAHTILYNLYQKIGDVQL